MKKLLTLVLASLFTISLIGCGGGKSAPEKETATTEEKTQEAKTAEEKSEEPAQPDAENAEAGEAKEKLVIAVAINALDEYQTEWFGYVEEYAKSLGHEIISTNAEGNVDKQITDIESLIQRNPDVILIRAVDPEGLVPAFEACAAAGIPSIDSDFGTVYEDTVHLASSQAELGRLQGVWCNEWLEENPDKEIKAGYLIGVQFGAAWDRYGGWKGEIEAGPNASRFSILAEKVCNWSASEAMAAVEDWVQAYPDMNTIVAMSDEMAIAAVNVIQAANKGDQIKVVGIDGSPNGQKHIRDGSLAGSSFTPRKELAQKTIDYAIDVANGKDLKGQAIDIGKGYYAFLTKDNIDEELAKFDN